LVQDPRQQMWHSEDSSKFDCHRMMSVVSQMYIITVAQMPGELVNSNIIALAFHSRCDIYPDLEGLHTGDDGQFAQESKN
jgi:hypothetical protein